MTDQIDGLNTADGSEPTIDNKWHRVSPMAIVDYAITIISAIAQQWSALLPLFVLLLTTGEDAPLYIGLAVGGLFILASVIGILTYLYFRYRIDGSQFLVRRGVISRKRLTLDFDRVQSINISEPIYFRPFKLAVLKLESAGSAGQEVSLNGINIDYARSVRARVLAYQKDHVASEPAKGEAETGVADASPPKGEQELLSRDLMDIVRYGLSNNGIWLFAALFSSFLGSQAEDIGEILLPNLQPMIDFFSGFGLTGKIALVLLIMLGIVVFLLTISVISAIFQFLGYRLVRDGDRLIRTSGLGEKREASLKLAKVQTITWSQNIIALWLKRTHIRLRQAGYMRNANQPTAEAGFIIPSLTDEEAVGMTQTLDPELVCDSIATKRVSKRYITRTWFMIAIWPILGLTIPTILVDPRFAFGYLIALVPLPFIVMAWAKAGYGWNATHGLVKGGMLGATRSYFPLYKVQHVTLSQSPGQRRSGFASLKIALAGNSQHIYWMPLEDAEAFRDLAIYKAETDRRHWI